MSSETWDVDCYICGLKLGSNKEKCGTDKRSCKMPPCKWAHTDSRIVTKCLRIASEKQQKQEEQQQAEQSLRESLNNGSFVPSYEEPIHPVDETREAPEPNGIFAFDSDFEEDKVPKTKRLAASQPSKPPAKKGVTSANDEETRQEKQDKKDEKRTKWNCATRTMFFKCIQKFDPFSSPDKGKVWITIADEMNTATATFEKTDDGDFRVYSGGKTLNVFYVRCRDKFKESEDGDRHSGGAGKEDEAKTIKEERNQLAACIELERSAKEACEARREVTKAYDSLRTGEVNDMVIACAVSNEVVRGKVVKVLASKLRAAKLRKIAWETKNKGAKYTYTDADMQDFNQWNAMREQDNTLPLDPTDAETSDVPTSAAPRGGTLASSISQLLERMPTTPTVAATPSEFASAFWKARREQQEDNKLSLKDKLAIVDKDVTEKTITEQEGEAFKKQIKKDHYKF